VTDKLQKTLLSSNQAPPNVEENIVWGQSPPAPTTGRLKLTQFYAHFGQNGYFKTIARQLKAF